MEIHASGPEGKYLTSDLVRYSHGKERVCLKLCPHGGTILVRPFPEKDDLVVYYKRENECFICLHEFPKNKGQVAKNVCNRAFIIESSSVNIQTLRNHGKTHFPKVCAGILSKRKIPMDKTQHGIFNFLKKKSKHVISEEQHIDTVTCREIESSQRLSGVTSEAQHIDTATCQEIESSQRLSGNLHKSTLESITNKEHTFIPCNGCHYSSFDIGMPFPVSYSFVDDYPLGIHSKLVCTSFENFKGF